MARTLRNLVKYFYLLIAVLLIVLAIAVQSGRSFSHLLGDYNQDIADYLAEKLNAQVAIGGISATWDGLMPNLDIRDLSIRSQTGLSILDFERARIRLDILESLLKRRWVWSSLVLNDVGLEFVQLPKGNWRISGLPESNSSAEIENGPQINTLVDMLLLSNRIEFAGTRLNFTFSNGKELALNAPRLLLENAQDFHRLSLQIDINDQPRSAYLLLEGRGDPRNRAQFNAQGFLQLNDFPTGEPLAAVSAFLLQGANPEHFASEGQIDANLWFDLGAKAQVVKLTGDVGLEHLYVPVGARQLQLDGLTTQVVGAWHFDGTWALGLQDLAARLHEHSLSGLNLAMRSKGAEQPLELRLDKLDLANLGALLETGGVLGKGKLSEVISTLAPRGQLSRLVVNLPLKNPKDWSLKANIEQLELEAWRGVPRMRGVRGYLDVSMWQGHVNLDSGNDFSMQFIPTYTQPMAFDAVRGQVAWKLDPEHNQVFINSGKLQFARADERVSGYMWVAMPWNPHTGDVELYLLLGGTQLGASRYQAYLPALAPDSLHHWLDRSVGDANPGSATTAGFVYRASLVDKDPLARSFDLYLDLNQASLDYAEGWPALSQLQGRLLVSNSDVHASVASARVANSQVTSAEVSAAARAEGEGTLLKVRGQLEGGASDGLNVLRQGALRQLLGNAMDSWSLQGKMRADLDLAIPLGAGEGQHRDAHQQVKVDLSAPQLDMKNLDLAVRNLSGQISYDSDKGLASEQLQASLFDEDVSATLSSVHSEQQQQTRIQLEGRVDSQRLARWSRRPELGFLHGKIPYHTLVELNHGKRADIDGDVNPLSARDFSKAAFAHIQLVSDLRGVRVDLPAPYAKTSEARQSLKFDYWLQDQAAQVGVEYGDLVDVLARTQRAGGAGASDQLSNLNIALGGSAQLGARKEFLLSGFMADFDLNTWSKVQRQYEEYQRQFARATPSSAVDPQDVETILGASDDPSKIAGLPFRADITLGRYDLGSVSFRNLAVQARRDREGWHLGLRNPRVAGNVTIPESVNLPLQVDLEKLQLSQAEVGGDPASTSPTVMDPRTLPLANIAVKNLQVDKDSYGSWSLQLRPNRKGVVIDKIHGSIRGLTISGAHNPLEGARLIWQQGDQGVQSRFVGGISAGDIAQVMRQWGKPDTLESKSAKFTADVYWPGTPEDFALINLNGAMSLSLEQGRFKRNASASASASEGILRLMSVLNFDSIARRMRLDFSDLYQSGLAYDEITGKVSFNQGQMLFEEPLEVRGPSSRLQMVGMVDLRRERLKTRLIATLPVAGNLTFFTALATGLPAAAGIYLVSKLFKKQVDQVTSISYTISGSWDDPKMAFDRLFESEERLRESADQDDESNDDPLPAEQSSPPK